MGKYLDQDMIGKMTGVACDSSNSPHERATASKYLAKRGVFIDKAGIHWSARELKELGKDKNDYLFGFNPLSLYVETPAKN